MKSKTQYCCQACGAIHSKWAGQCPDCGAWNSMLETAPDKLGYAGVQDTAVQTLKTIVASDVRRRSTEICELDRVLGGGIVPGAVVLLGGDPGIGKSTLLLQMGAHLSDTLKVLYVTGEESLQQLKLRAVRLGLGETQLQLLAATLVEKIIATIETSKPDIVIIDSIQTLYTNHLSASPGSVSQLREATGKLVTHAKQTNTAVFIVGHVTKEGALAGPKVIEHMVDTVMYFEGQTDSRYRVMRAVKNRFGAANELGVFAMTEEGLKAVNNPSAIFLRRSEQAVAGSVVFVSWEGSRPLLVEIQALVVPTSTPNPRRVAVGLDQTRLVMLLAVLQRHAKINLSQYDIFVNIVGGMKITEPALDMAVSLAIYSSHKDIPIAPYVVVFGEIGLSGEVRPVQSGQPRLKAALKHGFQQAVIPQANHVTAYEKMTISAVADIRQAIAAIA